MHFLRLIVCHLLAVTAIVPCLAMAADPWSGHPVSQWVLQSPREGKPAPNFPYEGSGAYDPYAKLWIHHAGHDGIPQGFHTFTVDLETGEWRQKFPPTSPPGVCCVDGTNCFDLAQRKFVRFPGGSLGHGFQWSRGVKLKESAVWLYDLPTNTWQNMRPPPYNLSEKGQINVGGLDSGSTYDPNHELALSFGGQGNSGGKNALFAYDAYSNTLHYLDAANPPAPRDGMGLAYDTRRDQLVMFGSQYLVDERTWFYDVETNRWEGKLLEPHPPAQKVTKDYTTIPRLAYDSVNDVILCLAWLGEEAHETWALDLEKMAWTKLEPKSEPDGSKSRSRNLSYDRERNVFMLESSVAKTNQPQMWTFRYREADREHEVVAPPSELEVVTKETSAELTWKASLSPGIKACHVYRAQGDECWKAELKKVAELGAEAQAYLDKEVERGRIYHYAVKAIGPSGASGFSFRARTQPRVPAAPIVSVSKEQITLAWNKLPAEDIVGYNVYRGVVSAATVKKGAPQAWRDNDPEYASPQVVKVNDITRIERLNDTPLTDTSYVDKLDLTAKPLNNDYAFGTYAYILRAVNRFGVESGPSPYALTIPSEPVNLFCREHGKTAELKWDASPEAGIVGYHVYRLKGTWEVERVTSAPIAATTFRDDSRLNPGRYWVVAVDSLNQEGQPSSPAWFNRSFKGFYEGEWHQ
jgi:hypothetical protein